MNTDLRRRGCAGSFGKIGSSPPELQLAVCPEIPDCLQQSLLNVEAYITAPA